MRRLIVVGAALAVMSVGALPAGAAITPPGGVYTWPGSVLLDVSTSPSGAGSVTTADAYINCPSECIKPYDVGQTITLTAAETSGFTFTGWTGDACTGQGNPCTFTISADTLVVANYSGSYVPPASPAATKYTLTVRTQTGNVSSDPGGIDCTAAGMIANVFQAAGGTLHTVPAYTVCTHRFAKDTKITLTWTESVFAVSALLSRTEGFVDGITCTFSDSRDPGLHASPYTFTMTADRTVTVTCPT